MPDAADTVNVALLAPGETVPRWAGAALERMVAETDAEITLVVEDASSDERSLAETLERLVELREWGVVAAAMELFADDLDPLERYPLASVPGVESAEWIACEPEPVDGWKNRIPSPVAARIGEADVAVRFGFGFLVGEALTAPEMGVLSFHHGDLREYRGQPMGFWEYVEGAETAGVTLQRINETLDGGEIVTARTVDVGDAPTWGAVRTRLFRASEGMLAEGVRRLQAETVVPESLAEEELGDLYTLPKGRPVLTYLGKTAAGVLRT